LTDRASGSCYLPCATHPLSDPAHALDRTATAANPYPLAPLLGQVRKFHPAELLALSGFPLQFSFPADTPLQKQYACIGNSVNVFVLRAILKTLELEMDATIAT